MGRLRVRHCVLTAVVRQYGRHPTSDLLGVNYFRAVPADVEFPCGLRPLELLVRFDGTDTGRVRLLITLARLNPDRTDRPPLFRSRYDLPAPGVAGRIVYDRAFKLQNVTLPGEGEYSIRVFRRVRRSWSRRPGWRLLASEYFWVERSP